MGSAWCSSRVPLAQDRGDLPKHPPERDSLGKAQVEDRAAEFQIALAELPAESDQDKTWTIRAQLLGDVAPVHHRHLDVEDRHIRRPVTCLLDSLSTVEGDPNLVTSHVEERRKALRGVTVVVGDQDFHVTAFCPKCRASKPYAGITISLLPARV